nr:uncharacterized protein LOC109168966 [Ipomoea trifida]
MNGGVYDSLLQYFGLGAETRRHRCSGSLRNRGWESAGRIPRSQLDYSTNNTESSEPTPATPTDNSASTSNPESTPNTPDSLPSGPESPEAASEPSTPNSAPSFAQKESKPSPSILTSNPFEIFTTPFARYHLFRQIIDANSPLSHESENRVLATLKFHQELIDDLSAKFHQASLKILKNSSQPMVTSASLLLEGTTSIPTSSLPIFSVNIPSFRSSHIPFVGSISAPFMRPSMCFSDSICVTPLPVVGSVPLLTSSSVCISESTPVCVSASVPVSVPYVSSLFVSEPIPDLSVTQFSEFHIRDVAQFVDQPGEPVSGSVLSIPMSVTVSAPCVSVSGVSLAGSENMSESAARS